MPVKAKTIVLDSWSIIAYLEDEPSGVKVERIIADAHEQGAALMTTVVNAGEVWYIVARAISPDAADEAVEDIRRLGIELIEADWTLTRAAAGIKTEAKMSYADGFAAALAAQRQAILVTGDHEFKQVAGKLKIQWI